MELKPGKFGEARRLLTVKQKAKRGTNKERTKREEKEGRRRRGKEKEEKKRDEREEKWS